MHGRHIDTDILASGKMAKMNGCGFLGCGQLGHAVKKGFDGFRHSPLHRLVDDIVRVLFPAIHGIDERPVAPGITVAFLEQGTELCFGQFNVAANPQRNRIALDQLIVAA